MVDKLNTYMLSGVQEFWVVDPKEGIVLVYSFKEFGIDSFIAYKQDETVRSVCFEGLGASLADVFAS